LQNETLDMRREFAIPEYYEVVGNITRIKNLNK
jgi:hypothetical protein